jgi:hypothetical protein
MAGKKTRVKDDVDGLFKLPLAEFTAARNALASQLKKSGRSDEAAAVKALVKPSITAWAVNQLYWRHPGDFRKLTAAGERFRRAQAAQLAGKDARLRETRADRRNAQSRLSALAEEVLREAGHSATLESMRRIITTLDALANTSPMTDMPQPGRLSGDLTPPGFESLEALIPEGIPDRRPAEPKRITLVSPQSKPAPAKEMKEAEGKAAARAASASAALEAAEQALREAAAAAEDHAAARNEAAFRLEQAENDRLEAADRLEKANEAARQARRRLQSLTAGTTKAGKALQDAERRVEQARKKLSRLEMQTDGGLFRK